MAFNTTLKHFTSSQELATIWATGENYLLNQLVLENDVIYRCIIAHTSGASFATDLAAGKWVIISGGASSSGRNYIENPNFNTGSASGWSLFNTTLTSKIPTGSITAGAVSITSFVADATTPIEGAYDLRVGSSGAITAGHGFISDAFTIEREDQAKVLGFSFSYEAISGTMDFSGTSNNTWAVYIYDISGSAWIQPAGVYNLVQGSGIGIASGSFQTTATGTQYRIAIVCITATSGAVEMRFDDFKLGPQITVQGAAISDWQSYNPIWSSVNNPQPSIGLGSVTGRYRRVGDSYNVIIDVIGGATTTWGTGVYRFSLPNPIDSTKVISVANGTTSLGQAIGLRQGVAWYSGTVVTSGSTDSVTIVGPNVPSNWSNTTPATWTTNDLISIEFTYPVAGLSSNTVLSQDTDTRVVAARITGTSTSLTASPTNQKISLTTVSVDKTGSWDSVNNRYVVPVSGIYKITGYNQINFGASNNIYEHTSTIRINTTLYSKDSGWVTTSATFSGGRLSSNTEILELKAGDTIELYGTQSSSAGGSRTPTDAGLLIERLSGPATIAASESVIASYLNVGGLSVNFGSVTTISTGWTTKLKDTHSAFSNGVFTVPVSGSYAVSGGIIFSSAANALNGEISIMATQGGSASTFARLGGLIFNAAYTGFAGVLGKTQIFNCLAGDTITIQAYQTATSPNRTIHADTSWNSISIVRVGN